MNCVAIHRTNGKIGVIKINLLHDGSYQVITDRDSVHYYKDRKALEEKWKVMYC